MSYEIVLRVTEVILQLILVVIAWKALSVWKTEIRGRDKYQLARNLLESIKGVRFLVHARGSFHQIYLNDILTNRNEFYKEQLSLIAKEKAYFDHSYWKIFKHLNVNTRSDVFLPREIRNGLDELLPGFLKKVSENKAGYTYIQIDAPLNEKYEDVNDKDALYSFGEHPSLTIEEYFLKWEELLKKLQKSIYE